MRTTTACQYVCLLPLCSPVLQVNYTMLPETLRSRGGYRTHMIGKVARQPMHVNAYVLVCPPYTLCSGILDSDRR